jgi:hypothetical protein
MSTSPAPDPNAPATTEQKVDQVVAVGGAVAEGLVPPTIAPVIAAGVELEPAIYSLIEQLIHLFHKKKVVPKS